MWYIKVEVLLLLSLSIVFGTILAKNDTTLRLVHVFFRHGSRTPEAKDVYPNDPYTEETFAPIGFGQLTNGGKQRAYKLGKLLRERYESFLGELYLPNMVYATCTDFDRTKMTMLLVLAGLFPPAPIQQWDDRLMWLPIPYHFERSEYDFFIRRPNAYCPTYKKELEKVLASPDVEKILKDNKRIFQYVAKYSGKPMNTLSDMFRLYQTLNAEATMNLTLPKWTETVYPEVIHSFAAKQCYYENSNQVLKRLNGGRMLKRVIENMEAKANGLLKPELRKIFLYSGHENNVINILATLDVFDPHVPKYSAAVIIELHYVEELEKYIVKVFYAKDVDTKPTEQTLPECGPICSLDKFIQITSLNVPQNYTAECDSKVYLR